MSTFALHAAVEPPATSHRYWWETRWFATLLILLSVVPLLYPQDAPLVDLFGHIGRYRVQLRLRRNRKVLASTSTIVTVRPGVRDGPYGDQQP